MIKRILAFVMFLPLLVAADKAPRQQEVKVQRTSMTREQEIQLGKEAASQVEREMEVIQNREIESWLNRIGQQLAKTPQANAYPYYFKLINEDSINAFALPGGPMYVHTGLIRAADREGEVAGVLAHEMSHVALRHGAAQMGKQQTWGTLFGVLGAATGMLSSKDGQCGMLCQAAQIGVGLGGASVLSKFSRSFEKDADLNGGRMLASSGYDPIDLAKFFEKLQGQAGKQGEPKGLELWLSSHPASGSRVKYVSDDIQFYPKKPYTATTGQFDRVKTVLATLPKPKPKPAEMLLAKQGASPRTNLPAGFKDLQTVGFAVGYPSAWKAGQPDQNSKTIYLVPENGLIQQQNGGLELISGGMIDYYRPQKSGQLDAATTEFVQLLQKGDANMKTDAPARVRVGNKAGLMTRATTKTSKSGELDQVVYLYTVQQEAGLWYMVLAAPPSELGALDPTFRSMVQTVLFPN
jgi:beta-barrel assembly-enhancing protease